MRKLKDLFLISVVLLLVSCSMSAKSDKSETGNVAAQGEVVVLNKADFLTKVYNYEKTNRNGYTKARSLVSWTSTPTGADLARKFLLS